MQLITRYLMPVAIVALALGAGGARADWTFVMLGDTRGERDTTATGVSLYLPNIAQKIASLNPELVLVCGDLVNGNDVPTDSVLTNYSLQFDYWKAAMQPVFNYAAGTGSPIYPVRGNHENCDHEGPTVHHLKEAYYDAFKAYVPTNGPSYSSSNDKVGFSYSFTHSNVTFAVADQYFYYDQTPTVTGYYELARSWVVDQFQQTNSPYKVFMAHEPIFNTEHSTPGGFFGDSAEGLQTRTDFWNELGTNGVQLYLTGHIHNETVASTTNAFGDTIIQLLAGNGGAALEGMGTASEPSANVLYSNDTQYGFALATVGDTSMTINYYLLNPADETWSQASYSTTLFAIPEPSSALLFAAGVLLLRRLAINSRRAPRAPGV
jgi:hypothetical protein